MRTMFLAATSAFAIALVATSATSTQAAVFDDFESYSIGNIHGQGGWDANSSGAVTVQLDPAGGTNQVFQYQGTNNGGARDFSKGLGALSIANTALTTTMHLRFRKDVDDGRVHLFGLWDQGAATPPDVSNSTIDVQFGTFNDTNDDAGEFRLTYRTGGGATLNTLHNDLAIDTWYDLWAEIDQATDTVDVFLQGGAILSKTQVGNDLAFNNAVAGSLDGFVGTGGEGNPFSFVYLDDIEITEAVPAPEPQTVTLLLLGIVLCGNRLSKRRRERA